MNKNIKIEHFSPIDYTTLMKVVNRYCEIYGRNRDKLAWEKGIFNINDKVYFLVVGKEAVKIEIDDHYKPFWVKVNESRTQYTFKIWYGQ